MKYIAPFLAITMMVIARIVIPILDWVGVIPPPNDPFWRR